MFVVVIFLRTSIDGTDQRGFSEIRIYHTPGIVFFWDLNKNLDGVSLFVSKIAVFS